MQFNSYIFILAFLPIFLISYFALNRWKPAFGNLILIAGSALFFAYGGWESFAVFCLSLAVNFLSCWLIQKKNHKKLFLVLDILFNVLLLLYFKYMDFFISNLNALTGQDIPLQRLFLPLGISFFTFQQIMYVAGIYKEELALKPVDYLAYILYFPKIVMGPLNEPVPFLEQFHDAERRRVNWDNIANGLKIFSLGLFKKLVLADTFAGAVSWAFSNMDTATSMDWMLAMLFYTFQIYFDFSGYTNMAVGVSNMLNITLPMNFDSPYKALSIQDFWKRWHLSLTKFFTKYIYIPLGGSRKGNFRTYLNILIIFLVSGIWHGANWTFILWGLLHGAFMIFDRMTNKYRDKVNPVVQWACTFLVINVLWLLFRSDSISQWKDILVTIVKFKDTTASSGLLETFVLPETPFLLDLFHLNRFNTAIRGFSLLVFTVFSLGTCLIPENNYKTLNKNSWFMLAVSVLAFVWGFLCLSAESVFVYFNF